jgi:tetratricopeptide (TPR) repeat protein
LVRLTALSLHPPYRSDLADVVDAGVATNLPKAESEAAAGGAEWLDRQMRGLVAAVRVAASSIEPCIAGELALLLNGYLTAKDDRDSRLEVLTLGREASAAAGRPDLVSRLGLSLFGAGRQSGRHPKDLLPIAEQTLEQIEAGGNSSLRVAALHQIALTAYDSCDFDRAQQFARAALEAAYTGGAGAAAIFRGSVLGLLGRIRWYADTGNGEEAVALLREAAQVEAPGSRRRAIALSILAEILTDQGRAADAEAAVQEARQIVTAIGDPLGAANLNVAAARAAVLLDDPASARRLIASARDVFRDRPDSAAEALLAVAEAELATAEARPDDARRTLEAAVERAERSGIPLDLWTIRRRLDSAAPARQPEEVSTSADDPRPP